MSAATIAAALGSARREGGAWRCRCPLHGGRSLVIRDGGHRCVLVTCWAGCHRLDVLAELRRHGLLNGRTHYAPQVSSALLRRGDTSRIARALSIWRDSRFGAGTIIERYLASRDIALERWPSSLRFHPTCPRPRDDAGNLLTPLPAMVALVEHVERGPMAVHCTYLRPDGSAKADLRKKEQRACFGPVAGGAVRLGMPRADEWLAVSEGTETALSVAIACAMPAWAALSAGGITNLVLPPEATHVLICADHDAGGTGKRATRNAVARWLAEGRRVRVAMPPRPDSDFNDLLRNGTPSLKDEASHVIA
jgi:putative DNA primase/helicase